MKNLFLVLLTVVILIGVLLAGCSQPTTTTTIPPTKPTTTAPTTTAPTSTAPTTTAPTTTAPTTTPTTSEKYGGTLRVMASSIQPNIGWPLDMVANPTGSRVLPMLETLLRGSVNGDIYGWLAESYEIANDGSSISFHLRQGIKFHDGSDLNAEVVKWNLDNWIDAGLQPLWESVDIIDGYTVRVNLTTWNISIPLSFLEGSVPVFMISKQAYDTYGLDYVKTHPVGTGPFIFASFTSDVSLKCVRNPDYWVEGKPYLDGIDFIINNDPTIGDLLLMDGEVDVTQGGLDPEGAARLTDLGFVVQSAMDAIWALVPDTANPDSPWANEKVREAAEYAIDKEGIAELLGYGYLEAPYQYAPRTTAVYNPNFPIERKYDTEKARQLLEEAGLAGGFETTIIVHPARAANLDYILAAQAQLAQVGIIAELDICDKGRWATYMGPPNSWPENSVLYAPFPRFDANFLTGIQFPFNLLGKSWLRPAEAVQALDAALQKTEYDVEDFRAVVEIVANDAALIPVHEELADQNNPPWVHLGFNERAYVQFWNPEDAWIDQ
jgi:peptide/nickel transport system substrate-binding protein